ncbi:MAG: glycosyltransferase [Synergistaceae bacterium]|nr:glycosyltransferase [Synergistaceae bacterium]
MNEYKVSVLVLTYNASYFDLKNTVNSVLDQKGIDVELIISDDGSTQCCSINKITNYLKEIGFKNYKILTSKINEGTVKNFYRGLSHVSNEYVKSISPGDMLYGKYSLRNWLNYIIEKKATWSFCKTIYYKNNGNDIVPIVVKAQPQSTRIYSGKNFNKMRWQYFVLGDVPVGAAILFKKSSMLSYVEEILNKVKYAEDFIFGMAMFDGLSFCFYKKYCVLYQFGTGISTSGNNIWLMLLEKDLNEMHTILKKRIKKEDFQKNMLDSAVLVLESKNKFKKIFVRGYLLYKIKKLVFPRKSISFLP